MAAEERRFKLNQNVGKPLLPSPNEPLPPAGDINFPPLPQPSLSEDRRHESPPFFIYFNQDVREGLGTHSNNMRV